MAEPATTFNLLFVCTGNTCRSPMAEAIARRDIARRGWSHVSVRSAGLGAAVGAPATRQAVEVAARHGLSLDEHRSQQVTPEILEWADSILAMSPSHAAAIHDLGEGGKVVLLGEFLSGDEAAYGIDDPFGGTVDVYARTFERLEVAIEAALDRLEPILSP